MVEDTKETPPSQQKPSEAEKKPAAPAAPAVPPARPAVPAQVAAQPRSVTPPPRPPAPVQAAPATPQKPKPTGRRTFLKALVAISAVLSIIPFVPWGNFLLSSVTSSGAYKKQQAVPDNIPANGAGAGKAVNVNDLTTFPTNSSWLITYPSSGDLSLDSQNPDTFLKFQLIRLPNGTSKSAADFVAFSKVCVHLWCSPNYDPQKSANPTYETYQCPCHGSIYEVPDGKAIAGPASLQAFPANAIPMLTLSSDSSGNLYIEPPLFDIEHNGVLGYGRDYQSYQNYILPVAEGKAQP